MSENLQYFEGLNAFIPTMPNLPPKLEDFFVEFDQLVHEFKIETLIGQEDGRPFAYEVDHKFMDTVYDQCMEFTFVPYEPILASNDDTENPTTGNGIGGYAGSLGLDSMIMNLSSISGASSKTFSKTKVTKLRAADWLNLKQITPDHSQQEGNYRNFLSSVLIGFFLRIVASGD
jgi:hypothetical protein